jgi:hypothetical protein
MQKDFKIAPFFILFLDAVSQLIKMNQADFEFNTSFLAYIASQVYTNKFHEFV